MEDDIERERLGLLVTGSVIKLRRKGERKFGGDKKLGECGNIVWKPLGDQPRLAGDENEPLAFGEQLHCSKKQGLPWEKDERHVT